MAVAAAISLLLPLFGGTAQRSPAVKSLVNAKQIALACKLYAVDHQGDFPRTLEELVPDYLPNRCMFICPLLADPNVVGYEYFAGKDTDPPGNVMLVGKAKTRNGRRVVVRMNSSANIEDYTTERAAAAESSGITR